jgi:hypothetical protein
MIDQNIKNAAGWICLECRHTNPILVNKCEECGAKVTVMKYIPHYALIFILAMALSVCVVIGMIWTYHLGYRQATADHDFEAAKTVVRETIEQAAELQISAESTRNLICRVTGGEICP